MQENYTNDRDEWLVRYLLNEMTEEEKSQVENWLRSSPENQQKLDHFRILWRESKKLEAVSTVNEEEAWKKFSAQIHSNQSEEPIERKSFMGWKSIAVAAAVILFISVGIYLSKNYGNDMDQLAYQTSDSVITKKLSDGSEIVLNKHSKLQYKNNRTSSVREVILEGEAFFTVAPDKTKPFIISIDSVEVRVVGTSFNVKATALGVEVIVETGVVQVSSNGKKIVLNPGEKTIVSASTIAPSKQISNNQLYKYFRTREFLCDNTPLWQLVEVVNEAYGANIRIEDSTLRQLPISASFNNQSLETILEVVEKTFQIKAEVQGNGILLRK